MLSSFRDGASLQGIEMSDFLNRSASDAQDLQADGQELVQRFCFLASKVSQMAEREKMVITPFRDPQLKHFSSLEILEKERVLEQLSTLAEVCESIQMQGQRITSVKTLTWAFLKHFHCTAPSDLLNHMDDGDIVDAYGTSHRMLFAGLTFFKHFSYTLEEFYCQSWMELFEREDSGVQSQLFELSQKMLSGDHAQVVSTKNISSHICREKKSDEKVTFRVDPQFFAPLYSKGSILGYLCANRGEVLSRLALPKDLVKTKPLEPSQDKN